MQCCCYALHLHNPLILLPEIYFNVIVIIVISSVSVYVYYK